MVGNMGGVERRIAVAIKQMIVVCDSVVAAAAAVGATIAVAVGEIGVVVEPVGPLHHHHQLPDQSAAAAGWLNLQLPADRRTCQPWMEEANDADLAAVVDEGGVRGITILLWSVDDPFHSTAILPAIDEMRLKN